MSKLLLHILCWFIPSSKKRKAFREKYREAIINDVETPLMNIPVNRQISYYNIEQYVSNRKLIVCDSSPDALSVINSLPAGLLKNLVDPDTENAGKHLLGIEIVPLSSLAMMDGEDVVAIITDEARVDIVQQLKTFGVNNIIYSRDLLKNSLIEADAVQYTYGINLVYGPTFFLDNMSEKVKNKIAELEQILEDESSKRRLREVVNQRILRNVTTFEQMAEQINEPTYFSREIYSRLHDEEIIVDAGLEDIGDFHLFYNVFNSRIKKFYGYEANGRLCDEISKALDSVFLFDLKAREYKRINKLFDVQLFPLAVTDRAKEIIFYKDGNPSLPLISMKGCSIDETVDTADKITLIKLDIEGAELDALKGARKVIESHRPRLMVCVYHKADDLWEIPLYIKKTYPDYKIYLRNHWGARGLLEMHAVVDN